MSIAEQVALNFSGGTPQAANIPSKIFRLLIWIRCSVFRFECHCWLSCNVNWYHNCGQITIHLQWMLDLLLSQIPPVWVLRESQLQSSHTLHQVSLGHSHQQCRNPKEMNSGYFTYSKCCSDSYQVGKLNAASINIISATWMLSYLRAVTIHKWTPTVSHIPNF